MNGLWLREMAVLGARHPSRCRSGSAHSLKEACGSGHNGVPTAQLMQFFRSYLLPALIVLLFAVALLAVSARIWLPGDML
ncbi:MAG: hypothetical protein EBZ29_12765, partial [Synechococcaceae bacterium WB9_4xC_028]|nr:hypothetical protein [Synechococcaceae bacterium WB9_4xC_028]